MRNNPNSNFLSSAGCELERMAVEEAIKRRCFNPQPTALVIPGRCDLSFELARKGVLVDASDFGDFTDEEAAQRFPVGARGSVHFLPITLDNLGDKLPSQPFDMVICRSGLCALPYGKARDALRQLLRRLKIGGRLYLSVLGLHSLLGHHYTAAEKPVSERYCELAPAIADKYGIPGEICLYTERDLFTLILEAGGSVLRTFTTTHGSLKGVAVRV